MKTLCFLLMSILSLVKVGAQSVGDSVTIQQVRLDFFTERWAGVPLLTTTTASYMEVSSEGLDTTDVILLCRYFGFDVTNPGVLLKTSTYAGAGPYGRAVFHCTGTEESITECAATYVGYSSPSVAIFCIDDPFNTAPDRTTTETTTADEDDSHDYLIAIIVIVSVVALCLLIVLVVLVVLLKKRSSTSKTAPMNTPPGTTTIPVAPARTPRR